MIFGIYLPLIIIGFGWYDATYGTETAVMPIAPGVIVRVPLRGALIQPIREIPTGQPQQEPKEKPKEEPEKTEEAQPPCASSQLEDPFVKERVQNDWMAVTQLIENQGFSIKQLRAALSAVKKEIDIAEAQKQAKDSFLRTVQKPFMLLSGDSKAAIAFRKNIRTKLLEINKEIGEILGEGKDVLAVEALVQTLKSIDAKQKEIDGYDSAQAMVMSNELSLPQLRTLVKNAVFLVKNTGSESQRIRKAVLMQLQRALATTDNIIKTKCKVWETLR